MLSRVYSIALLGLDPCTITVEVDTRNGRPVCIIVGLADVAVKEAEERVKSAVKNSGFEYWQSKIIISLAPSNMKKTGSAFDLPMAVGLLLASRGAVVQDKGLLQQTMVVGELALDGSVRHVMGVLPMVMGAKKLGFKRVIVPWEDGAEASLISGIEVVGVSSVKEAVAILEGSSKARVVSFTAAPHSSRTHTDLADINGQEQAKRVLEICAAGGHNVLFSGPPGAGKTMLAHALQSLLPPLTSEESLEVATMYSLAGLLPRDQPLITERPFRAPHHTASAVSLVGGGRYPRPGEISLAHRGILFLDEIAEFPTHVLDVLRQPLESGTISIARALHAVVYPAQFTFVAAMNPCPCGYATDTDRECSCSSSLQMKYRRRISGPLLDRIDVYLEVPRVPVEKFQRHSFQSESSEAVRARVLSARDIQRLRFHRDQTNSRMTTRQVLQWCELDEASRSFLRTASQKMQLSVRGYHRVLKVSRTIADLAGSEKVMLEHLAEAVQYRQRVQ